MDHFYEAIDGWFDDDYRTVYADVVAAASDGACFVEVGAWKGKSTAFLAVEIINSGKRITLHVVDHFKGSPDEDSHVQAVRGAGGSMLWTFVANFTLLPCMPMPCMPIVHVSDSVLASGEFPAGSCDMVFLDAQHSEASVAADIAAWWPKVKPGGILAGHDWNYTSVATAVRAAFGNVETRGTCWLKRKDVTA